MRALQTVAAALGGAVAVLLLLELVPARTVISPPAVSHSKETIVSRETGRIDVAQLRHEMRATIRAELSAARQSEPVAEHLTMPPTAEQATATDAAMLVISNAADNGRWTAEDRDRLRATIEMLHPSDREEVLAVWAAAVNEQRLRPDIPPI